MTNEHSVFDSKIQKNPQRYKGSIHTIEELKDCIALSLPIEIWDVDMNTIRSAIPSKIQQAKYGIVLSLDQTISPVYVYWLGLNDPSYSPMGIQQTLSDREIMERHAGMYAFYLRDDAVLASLKYRDEREAKRAAAKVKYLRGSTNT